MLVRIRREEPRTVWERRESTCRRVLMMSRGWTMAVDIRPAERPAMLEGFVSSVREYHIILLVQ
jgi:hypothetical protein